MNKKICEVCSQNEQKYRCPKCKIVYCSLNCFKTHKGIKLLFSNFKAHQLFLIIKIAVLNQ
jgi:hypothetical protein